MRPYSKEAISTLSPSCKKKLGFFLQQKKKKMENLGIDPSTSCMQRERATVDPPVLENIGEK